MNTHLFLFGGGPPISTELARQFSILAKEHGKRCVCLVLGRPGWEEYRSVYMSELEKYGLEFVFAPLVIMPTEHVVEQLEQCAAIVIGGGVTDRYIDEIVETTIGDAIKHCYNKGIPVAGFSAGAIISMEESILSPKDNEEHVIKCRKGLGLMKQTVVAVHYSEWGEEEYLLKVAERFGKVNNYGLDEQTGLYVKGGKLHMLEGRGAYVVKKGKIHQVRC